MTTIFILSCTNASANSLEKVRPGNFGLPGVIDLPTARSFPDGEIVLTHQNHKYIFMNGISFQALPYLGLSFRYGGQGRGGGSAQGRVNWDRSFDAHISLKNEGKYSPAISLGLRDFIGTGWYSSEYIVGTKSLGNLEITAGLGFGRLAGRNTFSNPLGMISAKFDDRGKNKFGKGGTLGTINWFQGDASVFYGVNYTLGKKITFSAEYLPDLMERESSYLDLKSPWNFGAAHTFNKYLDFSAQYLHGSEFSLTAHLNLNPERPPMTGGKELAPVPMRLRNEKTDSIMKSNLDTIKKVLDVDRFEIHDLSLDGDTVKIIITSSKFRSTTQSVGRIASTLQRFTSDQVKFAHISFVSEGLLAATYRVDLEKITYQQFNPSFSLAGSPSVEPIDMKKSKSIEIKKHFKWGIGPYVTHRLFNPDLPLSLETGLEVQAGYEFTDGLKLSGSVRKSLLTNLTDNWRRSNSVLPRVHSDWPLYDFAGQKGHIHELTLSYVRNLAPRLYGRAHAGLLEPFFAGIGGEMLYKPASSPFAIGIDFHRVRKRDYDMRFDLLDYETNVGHLSIYYDAGGLFNIEINAGKYLAGDLGVTTTISRKFASGWEVGGYATLTDVPFERFGEGSFDKAIYFSFPIDWIISSPTQAKRRLVLRPITRDGGANLSGARRLFHQIERFQDADFQRELGRLWK